MVAGEIAVARNKFGEMGMPLTNLADAGAAAPQTISWNLADVESGGDGIAARGASGQRMAAG